MPKCQTRAQPQRESAAYLVTRRVPGPLDALCQRPLMAPPASWHCGVEFVQRRSAMSWPIGEFGMATQPSVLAAARSSSPGARSGPPRHSRAPGAASPARRHRSGAWSAVGATLSPGRPGQLRHAQSGGWRRNQQRRLASREDSRPPVLSTCPITFRMTSSPAGQTVR